MEFIINVIILVEHECAGVYFYMTRKCRLISIAQLKICNAGLAYVDAGYIRYANSQIEVILVLNGYTNVLKFARVSFLYFIRKCMYAMYICNNNN